MAIARFDPFTEISRMQRMMDRMLGEPMLRQFETFLPFAPVMACDLEETDNEFVFRVALPGVKPEDVDISVSGNLLTIRATIFGEREAEGRNYLFREFRPGTFTRSFTLPAPVKAEEAKAEFENGLLILTLPKAEEARMKRIEVKPMRAIEQPAEVGIQH